MDILKAKIDRILYHEADHMDELVNLFCEAVREKKYNIIGFMLEYLPYSIVEDILLINHDLIFKLKLNEWRAIFKSMSFNPEYGKSTMEEFFSFHTSTSDEILKEIGILSIKNWNFQEINLQDDIMKLKNDHPRIIRKYVSLGLGDEEIAVIHCFKLGSSEDRII